MCLVAKSRRQWSNRRGEAHNHCLDTCIMHQYCSFSLYFYFLVHLFSTPHIIIHLMFHDKVGRGGIHICPPVAQPVQLTDWAQVSITHSRHFIYYSIQMIIRWWCDGSNMYFLSVLFHSFTYSFFILFLDFLLYCWLPAARTKRW